MIYSFLSLMSSTLVHSFLPIIFPGALIHSFIQPWDVFWQPPPPPRQHN